MPFVPAICTQCGAQIEVDNSHEAGICKYCGTAFITEKAINNYVVNNHINVQNASINMSGVNVENLLQRAIEFEVKGEKEKALEYYNRVLDENINNEVARAGVERLTRVEEVNIGGAIVSAEKGNMIIKLINAGEKVKAIKELREATGLGLKEAKDAVDMYEAQHSGNSNMNSTKNNNNNTSGGGCYVATAVYGSYDCPEVWTLRRYRDNELSKIWYGRVFIRTYYGISPLLVKWFGHTCWFKKICRGKLDCIVKYLRKKGYESTPYEDRCW